MRKTDKKNRQKTPTGEELNSLIRNRTIQYFWEQKYTEVFFVLKFACIFTLIVAWMFLLGKILGYYFFSHDCTTYELIPKNQWASLNPNCSLLNAIALGLPFNLLLLAIGIWLYSNWRKAQSRARKDFGVLEDDAYNLYDYGI